MRNLKYLKILISIVIGWGILSNVIHVTAQTQAEVQAIAWSPDGSKIVVGGFTAASLQSDPSPILTVRTASNMSVLLDLSSVSGGQTQQIYSASWSPDSKYFASASTDGTIAVWNVGDPNYAAGALLAKLSNNTQDMTDVAWSPDGKWIAGIDSLAGVLSIWSTTGNNFQLVDTQTIYSGAYIAWSPDSAWLATNSDVGILVYRISSTGHFDVASRYRLGLSGTSSVPSLGVAWNPTGTQIAFSDSVNNKIYIFDAVSSSHNIIQALNIPRTPNSLSWSPDGSRLAYGAYGNDGSTVRVVNIANSAELAVYPTGKSEGIEHIVWYGSKLLIPTASDNPSIVTAPSAGNSSLTRQVSASTDDVNEEGTTYVENQTVFGIGTGPTASSSYGGLRFNNLAIPRGSTITSARLQFYSTQTITVPLSLQIAAQAIDNAPTFSSSNKPSQRTLTTARVNHSSNVSWNASTWYDFNDMASVVQEVVNRSGWQSGNSLAIILRGTGSASNYLLTAAFDGGAANAPKLIISYIPPASGTPTPTPTPTKTPTPTPTPTATPAGSSQSVTIQPNASSDDVNEDGTVFDINTLALWFGNGGSTTSSYLGLRFNNVAVPRGATITSAKLQVYSAQAQWITLSAQFAAEATDNAATFSLSSKPSQRTLTTARVNHSSNVSWNATTWYDLDDISAIIQEVTNRTGWQSGNSLAIIVKGTDGAFGRKYFTSFDTGATYAPKLVITYTGP
jgi:WD40 repeat protein